MQPIPVGNSESRSSTAMHDDPSSQAYQELAAVALVVAIIPLASWREQEESEIDDPELCPFLFFHHPTSLGGWDAKIRSREFDQQGE